MSRALCIALVAVALVAGTAHAQSAPAFRARGEAADGANARQQALDQAFADVVRQALAVELTRTELARNRGALEEKIVRRARLFVASYSVVDSSRVEGRLIVKVEARVKTDELRARIAELGLRARGPAQPASSGRPRVVLLVQARRGDAVDLSFGTRGGDGGPVGRTLASQLGALGFDLVPATGQPAPTQIGSGGALPMDDQAARQLGSAVGAGAVVIVGAQAKPEGRIRATQLEGAVARAAVRVLATREGGIVVSTTIDAAAAGDTVNAALAHALEAVARRIAETAGVKMARHWPAAGPSLGSGRAVVVRGAAHWSTVEAVLSRLRAIPGARSAVLFAIHPGEVVLSAETPLSADQVAHQLSGLTLPLGTATVSARGDRVEVEIDGDGGGLD